MQLKLTEAYRNDFVFNFHRILHFKTAPFYFLPFCFEDSAFFPTFAKYDLRDKTNNNETDYLNYSVLITIVFPSATSPNLLIHQHGEWTQQSKSLIYTAGQTKLYLDSYP